MTQQQKITFNNSVKRRELAEFMANQPPVEVAMEACCFSHYWASQFQAMGHTVKLLPAQHVSPFVRGNKSDHNDAVAIAEAARRPNILPVPVKSVDQQYIQCLHRMRDRYIAQRTGLTNQTRGLLSEYGIVAPQGHKAFCRALQEVGQPEFEGLSPLLKAQLNHIADEYYAHTDRIEEINRVLAEIANNHPLCKLILSIPGIGIINATAIYSAIGNGSQFKNGREFAVWLGLTPRQASSGDSFKSGGVISPIISISCCTSTNSAPANGPRGRYASAGISSVGAPYLPSDLSAEAIYRPPSGKPFQANSTNGAFAFAMFPGS